MDDQSLLIIGFFFVINAAAFWMMFLDKLQSRKRNTERISEGMLFFMAASFGSIGVYIGMFVFRHKTQKWYFILGIPLLMLENCAVLYVIHRYLSGSIC